MLDSEVSSGLPEVVVDKTAQDASSGNFPDLREIGVAGQYT